MYEKLVMRLRTMAEWAGLNFIEESEDIRHNLSEAADAIEELQQTAEHYKGCADDWYKEACDYQAMLPRWIPVTERLPERNTWVLAYCKYKDHVIDYVDINGLWSYGNVTHWMPLPEPPKEKG